METLFPSRPSTSSFFPNDTKNPSGLPSPPSSGASPDSAVSLDLLLNSDAFAASSGGSGGEWDTGGVNSNGVSQQQQFGDLWRILSPPTSASPPTSSSLSPPSTSAGTTTEGIDLLSLWQAATNQGLDLSSLGIDPSLLTAPQQQPNTIDPALLRAGSAATEPMPTGAAKPRKPPAATRKPAATGRQTRSSARRAAGGGDEDPSLFSSLGMEPEEDVKDFEMRDVSLELLSGDHSSFGGAPSAHPDEYDEEDDEGFDEQLRPIPDNLRPHPIAGNRKASKVSVGKLATADLHETGGSGLGLAPVPDWIDKPPPEVYSQMNSKEKRQLRNKISARNFRHRRKEYIGTLEDAVKQRDNVIASLKSELTALRSENGALTKENEAIKGKWDEMLARMTGGGGPTPTFASTLPTTASPRPVPLDPVAAALTGASSTPIPRVLSPSEAAAAMRRTGGPATANVNKDVGPNGRRFAGGFGGIGNNVMVGTTFVPELRLESSSASAEIVKRESSPEELPPYLAQGGMNMNPGLSGLSADRAALLPLFTSHLRAQGRTYGGIQIEREGESFNLAGKGTHDDFLDSNPIYLAPGSVEEYRAQLYGKLANNLSLREARGRTAGVAGTVPQGWRFAFFSAPTLARRDSIASPSSGGGSPPPSYSAANSPNLRHRDTLGIDGEEDDGPSPLLASQHKGALVRRSTAPNTTGKPNEGGLFTAMASTFWGAFLGMQPSGNAGSAGDPFGLGKLKQAHSSPPAYSPKVTTAAEELESRLAELSIAESRRGSSAPVTATTA